MERIFSEVKFHLKAKLGCVKESSEQRLAEFAIIFKEILFSIISRRPQTFYKNQVLPSCQVERGKRDKFGKCNGPHTGY